MLLARTQRELNKNFAIATIVYSVIALSWSLVFSALAEIEVGLISSNLLFFVFLIIGPISYLLYLDYKNRPRNIISNLLVVYLVILALFQIVVEGHLLLTLIFKGFFHWVMLVPFFQFVYFLLLIYYIRNRKIEVLREG